MVIVGAGLAGSIVASRLADDFDVTVVELQRNPGPLCIPIADTGDPARLFPHVGGGPGGTTNYWMNGLIELENDDLASWPIDKDELDRFYPKAFELLSDERYDAFRIASEELQRHYRGRGVPEDLLSNGLFYPRKRKNVWNSLGLPKCDISLVTARARRFELEDSGKVSALVVDSPSGEQRIAGEIFIAAAGGLSTPLLIQATAAQQGMQHLSVAGRNYHDHPHGPVAQIELDVKLHDLWNFRHPDLDGVVWSPFVVRCGGLKFAFQLRPVVQLWRHRRRHKLRTVIIDLRNAPLKLSNYWRLAQNSDDILEILSFRMGWRLPTRVFAVWVIAEQLPSEAIALTAEPRQDGISRHWTLSRSYRDTIREAAQKLIASFGNSVLSAEIFPESELDLASGAHHCGTCRMALNADAGVCDRNAAVFELDNLFICDGSVIPKSGYANTGLTIAALALRLSSEIRERF